MPSKTCIVCMFSDHLVVLSIAIAIGDGVAKSSAIGDRVVHHRYWAITYVLQSNPISSQLDVLAWVWWCAVRSSDTRRGNRAWWCSEMLNCTRLWYTHRMRMHWMPNRGSRLDAWRKIPPNQPSIWSKCWRESSWIWWISPHRSESNVAIAVHRFRFSIIDTILWRSACDTTNKS